MEKTDSKEERNTNNVSELISLLNKVIFDVNLLIEKVKSLENFKKLAGEEIFEIRADVVDLKADNEEIKKIVVTLGKEAKVLEHEARILSERVAQLDKKTKLL